MLNLVPLPRKKELRSEKIFFKIRKICLIITISLICVSLVITGSYWILKQTYAKTQEDILINAINLSGVENLKEDIVKFNQILIKAKTIQDSHVNPLKITKHLLTLLPDDIKMTIIDLNLVEQTISFQGVAKDRTQLLKLQENLNNDQVFTDFNYPLGNLTEKENIDFLFEGKINLEANFTPDEETTTTE